jgi:hypothetical protein
MDNGFEPGKIFGMTEDMPRKARPVDPSINHDIREQGCDGEHGL